MQCIVKKETVQRIIENKGDYVLQLKANQKKFYEDVYAMFNDKYMEEAETSNEYETYQTIENGKFLLKFLFF